MHKYYVCIAIGISLGILHSVASAQQGGPKLRLGVKKLTEPAGTQTYRGVIRSIGEDGLTIAETNRGKTQLHRVAPIDVLREGGVLPEDIFGSRTYRWTDVKAGETVTLEVLKDDGDGVTYCTQICIHRRPGGKLPESQNPKKDKRYLHERLYNDIENGEDVSEEDIRKVFPDGIPTTGDLAKYQDMLDSNRERITEEKKAKELKAKPVADKVDPKKDDKK